MSKNYCYILFNNIDNRTYVGYTNNPKRRIRQHNGELKGGAVYTTNAKKHSRHSMTWSFLALVMSSDMEFTKNVALSAEWHIKRVKKGGQRMFGTLGRLQSLYEILQRHEKFENYMFTVYINQDFVNYFENLFETTKPIEFVSSIDEIINK